MASDKIKYDDLVSGDVNKKLKELEDGLKGVLKVQQDIIKEGQKGGKNAENIERTNKAIKESATARKGLTDIQKTQLKLNELETKEGKELLALKTKLTKKRRESKQAIEGENNAYKKLTNSTNKAQANLKKLAAQYGVNSKQAKRAGVEFTKLEKKLRKVNNAAKDGRRDVGRYGTAFSGLKNAAGALGLTAGIAGLARVVSGAVNIFKGFESANARLSGILGVTKDETKDLSDEAKRLGASTAFSATQVTQLQTEYAKLGFSQNQIISLTKSTIDASIALGSSVDEQAALTGSVIRSYGLTAGEAARVNDVFAKSASASALDFGKLNVALSAAAPVAKAAGVSLERTTALIGTLADNGLDASTAGTSLRNIFLDLSKKGLTYEQAMKKVNGAQDKLTTATELFGKRGATSALILAENSEKVGILEEKLNDAGGAAEKLADEQLDTLEGSLKLLSSAWEGFILSIEDGDGAISNVFRGAIDLASTLLGALTDLNDFGQIQRIAIKEQIERDIVTYTDRRLDKANQFIDSGLKTRAEVIEIYQNSLTKAQDEYNKALEDEVDVNSGRFVFLAAQVPAYRAAIAALEKSQEAEENNAAAIEKGNGALKRRNSELKNLDKQLRDTLTRLEDDDLERSLQKVGNRFDDIISGVEAKIKKFPELYKQGTKLIIALELERTKELKKLLDKEVEDNRKAQEQKKKDNKSDGDKILDDFADKESFRFERRAELKRKEFDLKSESTEDLTKLQIEYLETLIDLEVKATKKSLSLSLERDLANAKSADKKLLVQMKYDAEIEDLDEEANKRKQELRDKDLEAEKEYNKARIEEYLKTAEKIISLTSEELDKKFALRNEENAKEITETEENIDRQQELASQGKENQLAFEEKKLAEAHLREKEELEKQAKIKEGIALAEMYLAAYAARLSDNPDTAGTKALQDVLLASGISKLLRAGLGYEEGGYTGEFGTSEVAGVVHGQEFVIDAATTKQMGLRGEDMSGFKNRMFSGQMFNHDFMSTDMSAKQAKAYDNSRVVSAVESLERTIKSQPTQQVDVDKLGNLIETIHKNGVKTVIKYKGSNRI